jgi:hypothetical protein
MVPREEGDIAAATVREAALGTAHTEAQRILNEMNKAGG